MMNFKKANQQTSKRQADRQARQAGYDRWIIRERERRGREEERKRGREEERKSNP